MGLADRDYQRDVRQPRAPGQLGGAPVTRALLVANVAVFLLDLLVLDHRLFELGCFTVQSAVFEARLWEFITFQFLHGSVGHLLFNAIGLYFFGPLMERWWGGSGRFLAFYLLCGVAGGLLFTALLLTRMVPGTIDSPLIGASAGIYGLLIGTAVLAPHARVRLLFPPVEMSLRTLALGLLAIAVLMIASNWNRNAGGEAGHLGGAIAGFLLMRFPGLLRGGLRHRQGRVDIIRPPAFRRRGQAALHPPSGTAADAEVDRILDKISNHGLQSLTEDERRTLREAASR